MTDSYLYWEFVQNKYLSIFWNSVIIVCTVNSNNRRTACAFDTVYTTINISFKVTWILLETVKCVWTWFELDLGIRIMCNWKVNVSQIILTLAGYV